VKHRDAIYKDVYNATIRVQLAIHTCAFVMQLGHAHIHILINNWSKEKKKERAGKTPRFRYVYIGLSVLLPAYLIY